MRTVLCVRRRTPMRRDPRRPGARHASTGQASDSRPADRSPPDDQVTPTGVPHHADLFTPADEPSPADADEDSFRALIEQHREALYGYVLRLTGGDSAEAQDILKETFYRASQDPSRLGQRTSSVRPWLVLLARTVFQDGQRFQEGQRSEPYESQAPPARDPVAPTSTTVVRAMDNLSGVHREILIELFYRGTSLEEAAQARGIGVDTVKSRLYYAMRALRVVLDQQTPDRPAAPPWSDGS
jgi:RNA polymerase sigma-70 factor (ECF subfamily)